MPWTFGAGFVVNVTRRFGVGATGELRLNDAFARFALRPRTRVWLSSDLALDVSGGIFSFARQGPDEHAEHGAVGGVSLGYRDFVALVLDVDTFRDPEGRQLVGTVGIRFGPAITLRAFTVIAGMLVENPPRKPGWMQSR
jgi:hypothetical protein